MFLFYHECRDCAIDACIKKHSGFSERVCIDTQQKRSAGMRSLHPLDAERMGFGHRPTSILQRKIAFVRTNALLAEALKKKSIRREYRYKCCVPSLPFQHRSFPMPLVFRYELSQHKYPKGQQTPNMLSAIGESLH